MQEYEGFPTQMQEYEGYQQQIPIQGFDACPNYSQINYQNYNQDELGYEGYQNYQQQNYGNFMQQGYQGYDLSYQQQGYDQSYQQSDYDQNYQQQGYFGYEQSFEQNYIPQQHHIQDFNPNYDANLYSQPQQLQPYPTSYEPTNNITNQQSGVNNTTNTQNSIKKELKSNFNIIKEDINDDIKIAKVDKISLELDSYSLTLKDQEPSSINNNLQVFSNSDDAQEKHQEENNKFDTLKSLKQGKKLKKVTSKLKHKSLKVFNDKKQQLKKLKLKKRKTVIHNNN